MSKTLKTHIPFMNYRWQLLGLSMALVAVALFFSLTKGFNYGTDFKGGLNLMYQFQKNTNEGEINGALQQAKLGNFVVQRFGEVSQNTFVIKSDKPEANAQAGQAEQEVKLSAPFTQALEKGFGAGTVSLMKEEFVGPKVGKELRAKAVWAVILAWVIILIYVGFRFDFFFAPGAILALIHDVIIAIGAFAITGREVNLTVVAALLTIIGYSINDTIIVFDRIREDLERHKGMGLIEIVNKSINETLSRTIITSLTVFFVSLVLYFMAEGDIQSFGFAMIFGVITGTYSSIFIASTVFVFLKKHGHKWGMGKSKAVAEA